MLKIKPTIECKLTCPDDGSVLKINKTLIPNMHCLADADCPSCGANYYIDLPTGEAIWAPIALNKKTLETYNIRNASLYADLLRKGFTEPAVQDTVPIVHKFFESKRIIIINCIDFLYGHSLCKLLNVERHLKSNTELGCCVLVPSQLVHLVPDGVAEIWEFPQAVREGWKWYTSLERWIEKEIASRQECFISRAHPTLGSQFYDLRHFVHNLPEISEEDKKFKPRIFFSYREDRLWSGTLAGQERNLQGLYDALGGIFPDMIFVIAGFGKKNKLRPGKARLLDIRSDKFDEKTDRLWMAYMRDADCAVGVHGSNMLLPSGLARSTVELVPRSRIGNTVQDFLFPLHRSGNRDSLLFYRMAYGNEPLSDISVSTVADLIAANIAYSNANFEWFRAAEDKSAVERYVSIFGTDMFKRAENYLKAQVANNSIWQKLKRIVKKICAA